MAESVAGAQPERTSTADPGLLSVRKSEPPSHLDSADKHSVCPFLCHTCGTTAANKILYLNTAIMIQNFIIIFNIT